MPARPGRDLPRAVLAGRGERFGRPNDLFTAIGLLLLVAPAAAVYLIARDAIGGWLLIVTIAAIGGLALAAGGQILLVLRIMLRRE